MPHLVGIKCHTNLILAVEIVRAVAVIMDISEFYCFADRSLGSL